MSSFIFWSLFSDQRDRHVDLEVSVEMYSHCIFPLTNLKTVSAVPLALVFESPSRCCRTLQYAHQHRFICKDQNNEKKNVNSGIFRCFIPLLFFGFKLGEQGVHEVNNESALDLRTFFAHRLEVLLNVPYNSVKSRK